MMRYRYEIQFYAPALLSRRTESRKKCKARRTETRIAIALLLVRAQFVPLTETKRPCQLQLRLIIQTCSRTFFH